jgi:alpha-D-ribose 1-methylphosphonate 5-triphosphate synthase subunit PhnG
MEMLRAAVALHNADACGGDSGSTGGTDDARGLESQLVDALLQPRAAHAAAARLCAAVAKGTAPTRRGNSSTA